MRHALISRLSCFFSIEQWNGSKTQAPKLLFSQKFIRFFEILRVDELNAPGISHGLFSSFHNFSILINMGATDQAIE